MSVTIREAFPNSFSAAIPILTPLYGLKCEVWQFMEEGDVTLGSDSECQFVLPLDGVEKRHCTLSFRAGALSVRRNGGRVWVNDIPVGREFTLVVGDMLTIGPRSFLVGQLDRASVPLGAAPIVQQSAIPAMPLVGAIMHAITPAAVPPVTVQSSPAIATQYAATGERIELEDKRKALESREQQLLELSNIVKERERSLAERWQMLEERAALLTEQRASIEKQQSAFATLEQSLKCQKDEMDGRLSVLVEREMTLASQFEASAKSYTQMQQSRLALAQQLEAVERRSTQLLAKQSELDLLAGRLEAGKSELESQASELSGKSAALITREADLEARLASLISREQSVDTMVAERSSDIDTRQRAIAECEAAAQKQLRIINQREEEIRTVREELELLRAVLIRQKVELEEESTQLIARSATLETQASQLTASKLTMDAAGSNCVAETRSIGQLAAIVAERESAIRAKQEAFQAMTELTTARELLVAQESKLLAWQTEIDARHHELADRVVAVKQLRKATVATGTPNSSLADQASSLQDEWQKLAARHAELDIKEAQIDELQANALAISRAADAERDALQNSNKELFCERNSLMQLSKDLQSREAGLHEREARVQHQTEELRSKFDALSQQTAAFKKEEGELDARGAELNRRIAEFAAAASERETLLRQGLTAVESTGLTDDVQQSADPSQVHELTESLCAMESERDAIAGQRDALMTAVQELQQAMQNAQADVEEASQIRIEFQRQESKINQLYQTIEEKSGQLQLTDSRFRQTVEYLEELQAQVAQLTAERDSAPGPLSFQHAATPSANPDEQEMLLLDQIESLRSELTVSRSGDPARLTQYQYELAERDQIISNLKGELTKVREQSSSESCLDSSSAANSMELDNLRSQLERSDEVLRDRDDLIRELRSRLMKQTEAAPTESVDRESLQIEASELDRRATLLDRREEEIREQARRVAESKDEVENQRRQLLDARQQLEIARAEIQVAMKQHGATNESAMTSAFHESPARATFGTVHEAFGGAFGTSVTNDDETDTNASSHDLRAELANLFGLKKAASEPSSGSMLPISNFIDLSEPAGESKAVSFHFADNSLGIIQTPPPLPNATSDSTPEPPHEENSDDFVRDYMEQLLNRSRKAAGNSLPDELKSPEAKRQPAAAGPQAASSKKSEPPKDKKLQDKKAQENKGQKTKSFIEQYMAGGFGDLTGDGSMPELLPQEKEIDVDVEEARPSEPLQPRVKIDRQKLRENMDSLRTLSTQSVENALVNHALRQERSNINGRITFIVVLVGMSAFLAIANAKGIIQQPSLIWVTYVATICAAAELARKYYSVRVRSKSSLAADDAATTHDATLTQMPNVESEGVRCGDIPVPAFAGTESQGVDGLPSGLPTTPSIRGTMKIEVSKESSKYFEL